MAHGAERVYLSVAVLPHACGHWAHGTWGLPAIGPPRTTLNAQRVGAGHVAHESTHMVAYAHTNISPHDPCMRSVLGCV